MDLKVERAARSDRPVLENLLSLYLHDFSEVLGGSPGADGAFGYAGLPLFFSEPGRIPFMFRHGGLPAGFALASRGSIIDPSRDAWDMSEFFVVRGLRRRGLGEAAAAAILGELGGTWEVRVLDHNLGASLFWPRAISNYTQGEFRADTWVNDQGAWTVFRFSCPGTASA